MWPCGGFRDLLTKETEVLEKEAKCVITNIKLP